MWEQGVSTRSGCIERPHTLHPSWATPTTSLLPWSPGNTYLQAQIHIPVPTHNVNNSAYTHCHPQAQTHTHKHLCTHTHTTENLQVFVALHSVLVLHSQSLGTPGLCPAVHPTPLPTSGSPTGHTVPMDPTASTSLAGERPEGAAAPHLHLLN